MALDGWIDQQRRDVIDYLQEENRGAVSTDILHFRARVLAGYGLFMASL